MEGAAGTLRGVKDAAYISGAGCGRGRRWGQWRPGGVWGGDGATLGLAVCDPVVADLSGLVLQRRGVPHGAEPRRCWSDSRGLQRTGVLLRLDRRRVRVSSQFRFMPLAVSDASLTKRGNDRVFRGSISNDLLNRWSVKSISNISSIGFRFSKNFCSTNTQQKQL